MKRTLITALAVLMLLSVTGCAVRRISEPVSQDRFKEVSEEKGMTVETKVGEASTVCTAKGETYNSQFYVFDTQEKCDAGYEYLISKLVTSVTGDNVTTDTSEGKYKKYTLKSTEVFSLVYKLDNTLLYVYSLSGNENQDMEEYIKALGY